MINALVLINALSVPGNGLAMAWWEGTAVPAVLKAASPSLGLCGVGSIGSDPSCAPGAFPALDHGVGTAGPCLGLAGFPVGSGNVLNWLVGPAVQDSPTILVLSRHSWGSGAVSIPWGAVAVPSTLWRKSLS